MFTSPSPSKLVMNDKMNLSFAGCGFLGLYHVGVASCFREYAPHCCTKRISGASAGALTAMALVCKLPLGESTSEILKVATKARSRALGPFHPSFDVNKIIYDGLMKILPADAHVKANGKLYISVTRVSDGKNVLLSQFDTKEELIKAIQCSCFIPLWSGIVPPKYKGIAYMDGGFSDNLPILDEHTISISPFSGESDICPQDDTYNLFQINLVNTSIALSASNLYRLTRILFPAHPEILSKMCQQGFDDALRFLQRNNKIACTRCIAISFTYGEAEDEGIENDNEEVNADSDHSMYGEHTYDDCIDCQYRRQIAVLDSLPDAVVHAIQEACDHVNKGVINWLFRHRSMKLLSILTIPYLLPIDITIVMLCKIWERVPAIKEELKNSLYNLLNFLRSLVLKMESKRHQYSAKFNCQLAMTEFDYSNEDSPQVYQSTPASRKVSYANIPLPKRKTTPTKITSSNVEKSNSFIERRTQSIDESQYKRSDGLQRKSYAGSEFSLNNLRNRSSSLNNPSQVDRRRSMIELYPTIKPPERVISKLNFGFTVNRKSKSKDDLQIVHESQNGDDDASTMIDAIKNLDDIDQANAIEIANKALDWERECLSKYQEFGDYDTDVDAMLEATKNQESVMAYYYMDEKNRVKVTEIFNIQDNNDGVTQQRNVNMDMDDDGFPEKPVPIVKGKSKSSLSAPSPLIPSSNSLSSSPSANRRQRKKSVMIID